MKKIYNIILVIAALIVVAPAMRAQTSSEGIVLNKTVTQDPDVNGVRWITLESFVTGSVKVVTQSKPSDIILVLDVSSSMTNNYNGKTRLQALKDAATEFVENIYENAVSARAIDSGYAGNRIAIISYSTTVNNVTSGWVNVEENITKNGDTYSGTILTSISNMSTSTGTRPELGLQRAIDNLLDGTPNSAREEASLAVVLFTDGYPTDESSPNGEGTGGNKFCYTYANNTLRYGYQIINTYNASLYTVGLITPVSQGNTAGYRNYLRVLKFMDWLSSNYPSSTSTENNSNTWTVNTTTGNVTVTNVTIGNQVEKPVYYQLVDENTDLSSIFKSISEQAGGSASEIKEDAIVEVDVVSNSFALPSGTLAENYEPEIYYAKCTGYDSDGKGNAFGDEVYIENEVDNFTNVDGTTSSITLDINGPEIETSGFNFALNWCGRHYTSDNEPYADGYKLIVKIPIVVNDDCVGGNGTATNEPGSGIYVDGVLVAPFPQPSIDLPTNLWIMKTGLEQYESAKFTIQRQEIGKSTWEDYTTVLLTGGLNEQSITRTEGETEKVYTGPMIKLQGLDSGYYYQVIYENTDNQKWSWQYSGSAVTAINTKDLDKNPVIFVNNLQDTDVLHAESKVVNNFGEGTANSYSSKHYNTE